MYTYAINRDYISQRLLLTNHVMIVINAGEGGGGGGGEGDGGSDVFDCFGRKNETMY